MFSATLNSPLAVGSMARDNRRLIAAELGITCKACADAIACGGGGGAVLTAAGAAFTLDGLAGGGKEAGGSGELLSGVGGKSRRG